MANSIPPPYDQIAELAVEDGYNASFSGGTLYVTGRGGTQAINSAQVATYAQYNKAQLAIVLEYQAGLPLPPPPVIVVVITPGPTPVPVLGPAPSATLTPGRARRAQERAWRAFYAAQAFIANPAPPIAP